MAKVTTCDESDCGKVIPRFMMHPEVIIVDPPTPFAGVYTEKQFCSWGCLMKYATVRYGKEVTGNAGQ